MEDRNTRDYINEESMLGYIQMDTFPVLPLRGLVAFPDMTIHLDVGRQKSIEGVNIGMKNNRKIFLVTQKDPLCEDPGTDDLYDVGIVADIKQIMKLPNGIVRILIDGIGKGYLKEMTQEDTYYQGVVERSILGLHPLQLFRGQHQQIDLAFRLQAQIPLKFGQKTL